MGRTGKAFVVVGLSVTLFGAGAVGVLIRGRSTTLVVNPARNIRPAAASSPVVISGSLSEIIAGLQARLRSEPQDWRSYAQLGLAYVQQARVTADPTLYPKADGVLQRSLQLGGGQNFDAFTGMAALAAARHDFGAALGWGERAVAANPDSAQAYAVVGDAQVEL